MQYESAHRTTYQGKFKRSSRLFHRRTSSALQADMWRWPSIRKGNLERLGIFGVTQHPRGSVESGMIVGYMESSCGCGGILWRKMG